VLYVTFTIKVTNWRTVLRREANELDSAANARAVDSLINYETVKYFNNEAYERGATTADAEVGGRADQEPGLPVLAQPRPGRHHRRRGDAMMWRAAAGVADGSMTGGRHRAGQRLPDPALHPAQLLGVLYREIRQSLTDIERMFGLLGKHREIADAPDAGRPRRPGPCERALRARRLRLRGQPPDPLRRRFRHSRRRTVAVVGHSGSGKSTLARLLFRFYDVQGGAVRSTAPTCAPARRTALRAAIGIVPQDTVLFNDTIYYNIQYGRPGASREEVIAAAQAPPSSTTSSPAARGLRDPRRRARPQALRRREAARGHRPRAAEEPARS
jgi:ABC-type transport system involved in Fe-S cluster assembly fused permease/ATPase subunit